MLQSCSEKWPPGGAREPSRGTWSRPSRMVGSQQLQTSDGLFFFPQFWMELIWNIWAVGLSLMSVLFFSLIPPFLNPDTTSRRILSPCRGLTGNCLDSPQTSSPHESLSSSLPKSLFLYSKWVSASWAHLPRFVGIQLRERMKRGGGF